MGAFFIVGVCTHIEETLLYPPHKAQLLNKMLKNCAV